MTQTEIKELIEDYANVNLSSKSRKKELVALKSIYCKICVEYGRDLMGKSIPLQIIANEINLDSHATVKHHADETWKYYITFSDLAFDIYNSFTQNNNISKVVNYTEMIDNYKKREIELQKEIIKLKSSEVKNSDIGNIINSIPEEKIDLFVERLKPMVKMICNAKF